MPKITLLMNKGNNKMHFIYQYVIVLFFVISTVLSLLLIQENTIFTKNNTLFIFLYFFLYIAFTYNIVSLSRNFLTVVTLYYIPLLFMMSFLSYWFIVIGGLFTPLIVSMYFSFWYPNYGVELEVKLISAGVIGMILLLIIRWLGQDRLMMYIMATIIMSTVEFYQNKTLNNGTSLNYGLIQMILTFVVNISIGLFVYYVSKILREKAVEIKNKLANYDRDDLTGLYNFRQLNQDVLSVLPSDARELTIIIIDIDHFKKINDTIGHSYGNEILQVVAKSIRTVITERFTRKQYRIYRYGGEELVIILEGHVEEIENLLIKLKNLIAGVDVKEYREKLTVSIGVTFNKNYQLDNIEAFKQADRLLYKVKSQGRDNYLIEY
ncbi:GGDEF domain-containing protein [Leuconostoc miyukkimchii]|uniref:GGDEF domain-containing protein n=1 Tax=Leuconostoc miyukkimchii TaxID=910540 RepID=UPI001C7CD896|nr:GGDEF domain-containing protein [Leuconostoc miyukkimchii]